MMSSPPFGEILRQSIRTNLEFCSECKLDLMDYFRRYEIHEF